MATPDLCHVQLNIFQIPSTATLNGQTRLRKNLMLHYFMNGKTKPGRRDRTSPDASESDIILLNHYMLLHPLARRLARPGTIPPYLTPPCTPIEGSEGWGMQEVYSSHSLTVPSWNGQHGEFYQWANLAPGCGASTSRGKKEAGIFFSVRLLFQSPDACLRARARSKPN